VILDAKSQGCAQVEDRPLGNNGRPIAYESVSLSPSKAIPGGEDRITALAMIRAFVSNHKIPEPFFVGLDGAGDDDMIPYSRGYGMNLRLWLRALQIIPKIDKEEWRRLDLVSRWLVATRSAVLVMTLLSASIAGLLAERDGLFHWGAWLLLAIGLIMAHATNNLVNDWVDFERGVDKDNYFRTQYGPQTIQQGLLSRRQLLAYIAVTGMIAAGCGLALAALRGWPILALMAVGAVFVFFYTWPLKYCGLGEPAVFAVWGPLMIGGGYYAVTGAWSGFAFWAGVPYALGVTTVIFGKHIDKLEADRNKRIRTLPVILGERTARIGVMIMAALQYLLVVALVLAGYFRPAMLIVLCALYFSRAIWRMYMHPRPAEPPAEAGEFWPMWFVAAAFYHVRAYGFFFLAGLIMQLVWR
jgi:1,4-dihydroxy-2-naphthoate octaprenyltransferase